MTDSNFILNNNRQKMLMNNSIPYRIEMERIRDIVIQFDRYEFHRDTLALKKALEDIKEILEQGGKIK